MNLEIGDNEIRIPDGPYSVVSVSLLGLRRPTRLVEVDETEYRQRPAQMRGVPVMYWIDGKNIRIWPAASHCWEIQVDLKEEKEAVHAGRRASK